ncbi:MAG: 1-pyrroline-5-carboxylate dehydrogenase, partial [Flavobacteriales bacterium]|nr:1-pyrroline-5-carboxylate dehydrogenase [Flavobacteriales bacterium]
MPKAVYHVPKAVNEPVREYRPGSPERISLEKTLAAMRSVETEVPMVIGGKEVKTGKLGRMAPPH